MYEGIHFCVGIVYFVRVFFVLFLYKKGQVFLFQMAVWCWVKKGLCMLGSIKGGGGSSALTRSRLLCIYQ